MTNQIDQSPKIQNQLCQTQQTQQTPIKQKTQQNPKTQKIQPDSQIKQKQPKEKCKDNESNTIKESGNGKIELTKMFDMFDDFIQDDKTKHHIKIDTSNTQNKNAKNQIKMAIPDKHQKVTSTRRKQHESKMDNQIDLSSFDALLELSNPKDKQQETTKKKRQLLEIPNDIINIGSDEDEEVKTPPGELKAFNIDWDPFSPSMSAEGASNKSGKTAKDGKMEIPFGIFDTNEEDQQPNKNISSKKKEETKEEKKLSLKDVFSLELTNEGSTIFTNVGYVEHDAPSKEEQLRQAKKTKRSFIQSLNTILNDGLVDQQKELRMHYNRKRLKQNNLERITNPKEIIKAIPETQSTLAADIEKMKSTDQFSNRLKNVLCEYLKPSKNSLPEKTQFVYALLSHVDFAEPTQTTPPTSPAPGTKSSQLAPIKIDNQNPNVPICSPTYRSKNSPPFPQQSQNSSPPTKPFLKQSSVHPFKSQSTIPLRQPIPSSHKSHDKTHEHDKSHHLSQHKSQEKSHDISQVEDKTKQSPNNRSLETKQKEQRTLSRSSSVGRLKQIRDSLEEPSCLFQTPQTDSLLSSFPSSAEFDECFAEHIATAHRVYKIFPYELAECYRTGRGVPLDHEQAHSLYQACSKYFNQQHRTTELYLSLYAMVHKKDLTGAITFCRRAIRLGDTRGQMFLSKLSQISRTCDEITKLRRVLRPSRRDAKHKMLSTASST